MRPTFAQLTHAVTTLVALVVVAILAGQHIIGGGPALAVILATAGTSLGIGTNPPTSTGTTIVKGAPTTVVANPPPAPPAA